MLLSKKVPEDGLKKSDCGTMRCAASDETVIESNSATACRGGPLPACGGGGGLTRKTEGIGGCGGDGGCAWGTRALSRRRPKKPPKKPPKALEVSTAWDGGVRYEGDE